MNIEKLNYLLALAEEQNVTRAAQRLFITQPTMTGFVNKLEEELGFKLFDRTKNPVRITENGQKYIESMQRILQEEQQLIDDLRMRSARNRSLAIGIGHIHSQMWMPQLAAMLLAAEPKMDIRFFQAQELQLIEALKQDDVDIVFGHLPIDPASFHYKFIRDESMYLLIPENLMPDAVLTGFSKEELARNDDEHPLLLDPGCLNGLPLIVPARKQGLFLNLRQFLDQYRIVSPRMIESANMIVATNMMLMGLGYMYNSPDLLALANIPNPKHIYICTLPKLSRSRKYYMVYKKENPNQDLTRVVYEMMMKIV